MQFFAHLLSIGILFGFTVSTQAQDEAPTIAAVTDQLASYLELLKNGSESVDAAGISQRALPSGYSLAVSSSIILFMVRC